MGGRPDWKGNRRQERPPPCKRAVPAGVSHRRAPGGGRAQPAL